MESKIARFFGDERLNKVHIQNLSTGVVMEVPIGGVFIFIGYVQNTEKLSGIVELTANGEIIVDQNMATNIAGVFAAGDQLRNVTNRLLLQ